MRLNTADALIFALLFKKNQAVEAGVIGKLFIGEVVRGLTIRQLADELSYGSFLGFSLTGLLVISTHLERWVRGLNHPDLSG